MALEFAIDPSRCIGCRACVHACAECDGHRGISMIHLDVIDLSRSPQTVPVPCMHCETPACARVCPTDAIKQGPDGVVHSPLAARCIGCGNCVLACPFGVPRYFAELDQTMKCDRCYDRTAVGLRPLCATVCPSGALFYGELTELAARPEVPVHLFETIGGGILKTTVSFMVPPTVDVVPLDVAVFLEGDHVR